MLEQLAKDGDWESFKTLEDSWKQSRAEAQENVEKFDRLLGLASMARAQAQPDACQKHSDGYHYGMSVGTDEAGYRHRCVCGEERVFGTSSSMKWQGEFSTRDYIGDLM